MFERNEPLWARMRPRTKKVIFASFANIIAFALLFAIGELTTRWYVEGSLIAALCSVFNCNGSGGYQGTAGWLVHDAELGYKLNPAQEGVNSLGIQHDEIATAKTNGLLRVIVLGDSVAGDKDGFVALLREHLGDMLEEQVEVINAAIPGYTTYQERTLLERDLLGLKPDLVILQYCLNDNHHFLHQLNSGGNWLLTVEAQRALMPEGEGLVATLMRSSCLLFGVQVRLLALQSFSQTEFPWEDQVDFSVAWQDSPWLDFETHLRAVRDKLKQIDARFVVVAVPYEPQLKQSLLDLDYDYTLKPQHKLKEICQRLDVPLLDLHTVFVENRHRDLYRDGIHLTPNGHELVAEELLEFLTRQIGPLSRAKASGPS